MKLILRTSLSLLAAFALWAPSGALADTVPIRLKANGYDDVARTTTILVTDGWSAFTGTAVASGHHEETGPAPEIEWDADGNPIAWGTPDTYWVDQWTEYRAELPVGWLGRGISFSKDGTNWTSFRLFNGNDPEDNSEQLITIDPHEWGQRALPNPDAYSSDAGNRLRLGRLWTDANRSVFSITSSDNGNETWPVVSMDMRGAAPNAFWRWFHPTDDGEGTQLTMELDDAHRLSLRGRSTSGWIQLDPDGDRILINGKVVVTGAAGPNGSGLTSSNATVRIGAGTVGRVAGSAGQYVGQIVLGKYNRTVTDGTSGVMIVGTGSSSSNSHRQNGLRIMDDGTVLILPKGDLEMDFTEGPVP